MSGKDIFDRLFKSGKTTLGALLLLAFTAALWAKKISAEEYVSIVGALTTFGLALAKEKG